MMAMKPPTPRPSLAEWPFRATKRTGPVDYFIRIPERRFAPLPVRPVHAISSRIDPWLDRRWIDFGRARGRAPIVIRDRLRESHSSRILDFESTSCDGRKERRRSATMGMNTPMTRVRELDPYFALVIELAGAGICFPSLPLKQFAAPMV